MPIYIYTFTGTCNENVTMVKKLYYSKITKICPRYIYIAISALLLSSQCNKSTCKNIMCINSYNGEHKQIISRVHKQLFALGNKIP